MHLELKFFQNESSLVFCNKKGITYLALFTSYKKLVLVQYQLYNAWIISNTITIVILSSLPIE